MAKRNRQLDGPRWTVDEASGCWLWQRAINDKGYGVATIGVWPDRAWRGAHRVVYEELVGPIPDGLQLDHLCRVRHCVNPDHLEPVTIEENILRGVGFAALNARKTECPHGHPYTPENTSFSAKGYRHCRTCGRLRDRERYRRKRDLNSNR